jgi:hypothetical protein
MRSPADSETPNSGASRHSVKSVRQYAVTCSTRSSSDRLHGRPGGPRLPHSASAWSPTCRQQSGLSPVNVAVRDGSDTVITPTTPGSSHQTNLTMRRSLQLRFHGAADVEQDRGKT